jgi:hypothetical protein
MSIAQFIVNAVTVYIALGVVFALCFVTRGVAQLDPAARGAGLGFRLLLLPGVTALWPWLAWRWGQGATAPPSEQNAHRRAALSQGVPQ